MLLFPEFSWEISESEQPTVNCAPLEAVGSTVQMLVYSSPHSANIIRNQTYYWHTYEEQKPWFNSAVRLLSNVLSLTVQFWPVCVCFFRDLFSCVAVRWQPWDHSLQQSGSRLQKATPVYVSWRQWDCVCEVTHWQTHKLQADRIKHSVPMWATSIIFTHLLTLTFSTFLFFCLDCQIHPCCHLLNYFNKLRFVINVKEKGDRSKDWIICELMKAFKPLLLAYQQDVGCSLFRVHNCCVWTTECFENFKIFVIRLK